MARCNFCRRTFGNAQAVRAHLRYCSAYQGRGTASEDGSVGELVEVSVPKARLPRSGVPIERDVPMDPFTKFIHRMRSHLETELRFRRIEALQRKLEDRNLAPLEELELLEQLHQEVKRLR